MKIVNIVLGLGTAIIVGALINLGIVAFHPGPVAPDYNAYTRPAPMYPATPCAVGDKACAKQLVDSNAKQQAQQAQYDAAQKTYDDAMKVYNRDVFIIANIAGIVVFIIGFWLLFATAIAAQSVPIGIMIAGLYGIIYGYARGWGSTDDRLKFVIGLVVAILVIGGSIWLIDRYQRKTAK